MVNMIKLLLKHTILELAINNIFNRLINSFCYNIITIKGRDINESHIGMRAITIDKYTYQRNKKLTIVHNIDRSGSNQIVRIRMRNNHNDIINDHNMYPKAIYQLINP